MRKYAELNLYRARPLSLDEVLAVAHALEPQEAFMIRRLNEELQGDRFSIEDGSEDITGNMCVPEELLRESVEPSTQEHISPELKTTGSFLGQDKEVLTEMMIDAYEAEEGQTLLHKMDEMLIRHSVMMSSIEMTYEYEKCEAGWQEHYYVARLVTKFDPRRLERPHDVVLSIQQVPYRLRLMCDGVYPEMMIGLGERALGSLRGSVGTTVLKTQAPTANGTRELLHGAEDLRKKYCHRI